MKIKKINKLYSILINGLENPETNPNNNFYEFVNKINTKSHWATKISINFFLFFIDFVSLIVFFKSFNNLSFEKSKKIINLFSRIIFLREVNDMLKKYALIFLYDKN